MLKKKPTKTAIVIGITLLLIITGMACLSFETIPFFTTKALDCTKWLFSFTCTPFQPDPSSVSQDVSISESETALSVISTEPGPANTVEPSQTTAQSITSTPETYTEEYTPLPTATIRYDTPLPPISPIPVDITATLVAENVHFVAPNGSNENPGTMELPWQSLHYAATQLIAGDTLYIRGGTYQEVVKLNADGVENAPIKIMNYPGETVVIDGYDTLPTEPGGNWLFTVWGDWYEISGLEVKNSYGEGGIGVKGAHATVSDCFVHHNWGGGITMMGDYGLAQNNRIWYNGRSNEFSSLLRGGWPAAITCARYPSYCTLKGNISWENWGEGVSTFEAYNSTIEENISYDNAQNIYVSDTRFSVIQRNLVFCTPDNIMDDYISTQNGILLGDEKHNPASSDNVIINNIVYGCDRNLAIGTNESTNTLVAHNTFVNAADGSDEPANVLFYSGTCSNCLFINNLILQENEVLIEKNYGVGWQFSNNLWSIKPPSEAADLSDFVGDPLLTKSGSPYLAEWYQLQANSPAINNAIQSDQVRADFWGMSRVIFPDIGAFEYVP